VEEKGKEKEGRRYREEREVRGRERKKQEEIYSSN